jgi:hypothetical protein
MKRSAAAAPRAHSSPGGGAQECFLTRLHVRYDREHFPEDLVFQETNDRENFQGRYVLRHPWKGDANKCPAAAKYFDELKVRQRKDAQTLAKLTGWEIEKIRDRMKLVGPHRRPVTARSGAEALEGLIADGAITAATIGTGAVGCV